MLIPSIDLMGGRIVQLVQGEKKALEFTEFDEWVQRFGQYSLVQLIDLDAAMGRGDNRALVADLVRRLPCQVGGGIRSVGLAQEVLAAGARRIIVSSALFAASGVNLAFAKSLAEAVGAERVLAAVDARGGKISVHGWSAATQVSPLHAIRELEPYCAGFLYTHIETEGLMRGIPLEVVKTLRAATSRELIVAGGIRSHEEVAALDALGVDAVVGMAIYTGAMRA
ncbi:MAG TPA: HisA/HisF-related TIM barrel protein [Terriglobales bacterium]|nr:HisA/HisF-related TIM barrel protein [Terriglobales bacterium]